MNNLMRSIDDMSQMRILTTPSGQVGSNEHFRSTHPYDKLASDQAPSSSSMRCTGRDTRSCQIVAMRQGKADNDSVRRARSYLLIRSVKRFPCT